MVLPGVKLTSYTVLQLETGNKTTLVFTGVYVLLRIKLALIRINLLNL